MYTIVMAMALSGSGQIPQYDYWTAGCYGCNGGWYSGQSSLNGRYHGGYSNGGYYQSGAYYSQASTPTPAAATNASRTTIVVTLPAEAKLTVNGAATRSTSATRRFITPPLEPDVEYFYILAVDMGQGQVQTQRVTFRAGQEVPVSFGPQTARR
jgi:uncharacterized protein (TIGR03000 family)